MRNAFVSLIILALVLACSAWSWAQVPMWQVVRRDHRGYVQWPYSTYDGFVYPLYKSDMYPGEHAKWSMTSSGDPVVIERYRRVLEEYDRVHGTHKNPYLPLPQPVQAPYVSFPERPLRHPY